MPFMPQRTGPPQRQNPMRIVQEIMMMKMQQNQAAQERKIRYDQADKERKENFKNQKALLEYEHLLKGTMSETDEQIYKLKMSKLAAEAGASTAKAATSYKIGEKVTAETNIFKQKDILYKMLTNAGGGVNMGGANMSPFQRQAIGANVAPQKQTFTDIKGAYVRGRLSSGEQQRLLDLQRASSVQFTPQGQQAQSLKIDKIMQDIAKGKQALTKGEQEIYEKYMELRGSVSDRVWRKITGQPGPPSPYKFDQPFSTPGDWRMKPNPQL